jgi:glycosyltransferase involved in cell wall biosynthesis
VPELDVLIPTIPGREASLERLLESLERHSDVDLNEIIVKDSPSCGEGWLTALQASDSPYVAMMADDLEIASPLWAEVCIDTVDRGFLPCPRVYLPGGEVESQGGDMNAHQHIRTQHRKDSAWCDYTTVPFMSREQADAIGMIPVHYCSDVWVSYRGRQLGYETVLRHGYDLIHHREPAGRGAGMAVMDRDAMDLKTMNEALERVGSLR